MEEDETELLLRTCTIQFLYTCEHDPGNAVLKSAHDSRHRAALDSNADGRAKGFCEKYEEWSANASLMLLLRTSWINCEEVRTEFSSAKTLRAGCML